MHSNPDAIIACMYKSLGVLQLKGASGPADWLHARGVFQSFVLRGDYGLNGNPGLWIMCKVRQHQFTGYRHQEHNRYQMPPGRNSRSQVYSSLTL